MDLNDIKTQLEQAPAEVKNFIMGMLFASGMAMKNVQENDLNSMNNNIIIEQSTGYNTLAENFLNGTHNGITKEYKDKFYKILREADKMAKEKYGHTYFKGVENVTKLNDRRGVLNEQVQSEGLEHMITNKKSLMNHEYIQTGQKPIYEYSVKIRSKNDSNILERYLSHVYIYDLNGRDKKIDLYIDLYNTNVFNEFNNLFKQYEQQICDLYSIEFFGNDYKKYFISIDKYMGSKFQSNKCIISFRGKIV